MPITKKKTTQNEMRQARDIKKAKKNTVKTTEKQLKKHGRWKIHTHPKVNTNGFDKNPQNINRNGRPKKGISAVLDKINNLGYEVPSKQDIEATYLSMLNLTTEELSEIYEDPNTPIMAKIIAKELILGESTNVVERLLNRAIGRSKEEMTLNGNITAVNFNLIPITKNE